MAKFAGLPWDAILSTELVRHYKPDKETYLMAAEFWDVKPEGGDDGGGARRRPQFRQGARLEDGVRPSSARVRTGTPVEHAGGGHLRFHRQGHEGARLAVRL
jgi:hypothetical protein